MWSLSDRNCEIRFAFHLLFVLPQLWGSSGSVSVKLILSILGRVRSVFRCSLHRGCLGFFPVCYCSWKEVESWEQVWHCSESTTPFLSTYTQSEPVLWANNATTEILSAKSALGTRQSDNLVTAPSQEIAPACNSQKNQSASFWHFFYGLSKI